MFPSIDEFKNIIRFLANWKATGPEKVFNFFIKKLGSFYEPIMYFIIKKICLEEQCEQNRFFKGTIYLIPNGTPCNGSDFGPITCMSNLCKLTTKCFTKVMQQLVETRDLLAEN
ncbi:hypothetical protein GINT2_000782 [Glugoides intestinalis]